MTWSARLEDGYAKLDAEPGDGAAYLLRHGTMRAGIYAPVGIDDQTPHTQDELYLIVRGVAYFTKGEVEMPVQPGDLLFVEAGAPHRFRALSSDFATLVVFWGPQGGEDLGSTSSPPS